MYRHQGIDNQSAVGGRYIYIYELENRLSDFILDFAFLEQSADFMPVKLPY